LGAIGLVAGSDLRRRARSVVLVTVVVGIVGAFTFALVNVVAFVPALSASRIRPGRALRSE
jgi:uncharacterized membrane protein YeaQ/YmgE (transglycosylase-associated protein family)